ncbi:hypothetical protein GCM10023196_029020 [Actinoallomurus vinaceus]|uniref:Uncharacterized protein n=1 Tax=Actinoallomurus vinaceus TaxID=1080074 RepID=A0ABP8U9U7_9ACTN
MFATEALAPAAVCDARCAGEHAVPAIPTATIAAATVGNGDLRRIERLLGRSSGRGARFMIIGAYCPLCGDSGSCGKKIASRAVRDDPGRFCVDK